METLPKTVTQRIKIKGCLGCEYDSKYALCTHPDSDKREFWKLPDTECYKRGPEFDDPADGKGDLPF